MANLRSDFKSDDESGKEGAASEKPAPARKSRPCGQTLPGPPLVGSKATHLPSSAFLGSVLRTSKGLLRR